MIIRELIPDDKGIYKKFISKGLVENEDSFRISLSDEANEGFPTQGTPYSFTLGAFSDVQDLMGIVSFKREVDNRTKLTHKGFLFRMYVANEYSGQGIAKALINELLGRASALPDIEQINLTVVASNDRAKGLYQKFGFQSFGVEPNAIKTRGGYFDEELMKLIFEKTSSNFCMKSTANMV